MKTVLLTLGAILLLYGCRPFDYPEKKGNLTILNLSGTPYQKGYFHGIFLKKEIDTIIQRWKAEVENNFSTGFENVLDTFFAKTTMTDTINKYCPDLLEEVRGIARGSKQKFKVILGLQMSEELENAGEYFFATRCTSISTCDNNGSVVAQNMDPPLFLQGYPTLLEITDKKTKDKKFVYTFPGFIGLCGMSRNVAVTCNGMSMLNHRRDGLPVAFIVRSMLESKNETVAFHLIRKIPHATPQCYTIGGHNKTICFECSANRVVEFFPFENKNVTLHTNFAARNRDFNTGYIDLLAAYGKTIDDPYYCPRYFLAWDEIAATGFSPATEKIKSILSLPKPEIEPISNKNTYGCLVMQINEDPLLQIAPGKPDETDFITLNLNEK